jgi:hypothetical protein
MAELEYRKQNSGVTESAPIKFAWQSPQEEGLDLQSYFSKATYREF